MLLAVGAVLLIAMALFLFGTGVAVHKLWLTTRSLLDGQINATEVTVEFLEVVSVMLKAVVFYLVGVGL